MSVFGGGTEHFFMQNHNAVIQMFVWLEAPVLMKAELSTVIMGFGRQCVILTGKQSMLG